MLFVMKLTFLEIIIINNYAIVQKITRLMVKIYRKKKLFVEFAWLKYVKVERPSSWNAIARVNLLWLTRNAP